MKSIALIHTVESVASSFNDSLRNYLRYEVKIHSLQDDFLASSPNGVGGLIMQNRNRLFCDTKAQELTGVDIVVTTCSTLTPAVELIRPFVQVPVIAIDDTMAGGSVLYGKRIMVTATTESTVEPVVSEIKAEAGKMERGAGISTCVYTDAFFTVKVTDMRKHDMILKGKAGRMKGYDCIVLAQAFMAHLEGETVPITGRSVFTNPRLCMEEIKRKLEEIQR